MKLKQASEYERDFCRELNALAVKYAPRPIVTVGEIVETKWGGKRPRKVFIYEIGVHLVSLNACRPRRNSESLRKWVSAMPSIGVELYYYAQRLKKDGTPRDKVGSGIALTNLVTKDGKRWESKNVGFNHCGLSWTLRPEEE